MHKKHILVLNVIGTQLIEESKRSLYHRIVNEGFGVKEYLEDFKILSLNLASSFPLDSEL